MFERVEGGLFGWLRRVFRPGEVGERGDGPDPAEQSAQRDRLRAELRQAQLAWAQAPEFQVEQGADLLWRVKISVPPRLKWMMGVYEVSIRALTPDQVAAEEAACWLDYRRVYLLDGHYKPLNELTFNSRLSATRWLATAKAGRRLKGGYKGQACEGDDA